MIESTCPRCGSRHWAPGPVTQFACCPSNSPAIQDSSLKQILHRTASRSFSDRLDRPGDAAYELIRTTFGITPPKGCGCNATKHRMNSLGWEKCLAEIDSLADELAANATKFGWSVTLWAAAQATLSGALVWMNPFRPWHSIIRESCRRTKAAIDGKKENSDGSRRESV